MHSAGFEAQTPDLALSSPGLHLCATPTPLATLVPRPPQPHWPLQPLWPLNSHSPPNTMASQLHGPPQSHWPLSSHSHPSTMATQPPMATQLRGQPNPTSTPCTEGWEKRQPKPTSPPTSSRDPEPAGEIQQLLLLRAERRLTAVLLIGPCCSCGFRGGCKLLGLSIATLSTVTRYGLRFSTISNVALESSSYRAIHHTAFYVGVCLSMTLILAALLSAVATVRESRCLTATAFFCFALAFCGLIPAAFWRYMHSTEVEDSMLDVYDLMYEEFLCCGKHSPLGDTAAVEHRLCPPSTVWAAGRDCLQEMHGFLKKHMGLVSTLLGITIGFTVYGMVLTSFLWFSIHFSNNLGRKGKYTLRGR
ncbi:tetraspanin-32 isoform X2 [Numida meleagris]|uniref:tetraspanin-32 isoform X2 n=1 Tax=Numida meleagris TaxID=8996 RepID=UPI000B3DDFD8|nr:tetraspanin-32 isoform X2 [Numida meleagris]